MTTSVLERHDDLRWHAGIRIDKFRGEDVEEARRAGLAVATLEDLRAAGLDPYDVTEAEHNLLVNGGITTALTLIIGGGGTSYANGNARILVGDGGGSVPTAAATDTDLAALTGASHRYCQATQAASPSVSAQSITAISVFTGSNANFAWNEWGIDSKGASGTDAASGLLNHKGVSLGTKVSPAVWTMTCTLTLS